jgi:enamine deaminase RidA (YjgF/YER057c/UK114 family)
MPLVNRPVQGRLSETNSVCLWYENATGVSEAWIAITSDGQHPFAETLRSLHSALRDAHRSLDLTADSHVFSRFFFSDIRSQKRQLLASEAYDLLKHGACSFIQQPPLNGADLSVLIYHVSAPDETIRKHTELRGDQSITSIRGNTYGLHFSCNLNCTEPFDSYYQTQHILDDYSELLSRDSMTIAGNTARTWLFLDDVANHYQGMVDARRVFFERCGLTAKTHFIASTGIEGRAEHSKTLVSMDALSIQNIAPDQVVYLSALGNLNPPHEYGVTFERGTKIQFGDRAHYHISGTASIDEHGRVIYQDDARKQTQRVVDNINALLEPDGSSMNDLAYLVVYIKEPAHCSDVTDVLDARVDPDIPRVYLEAKVCRPEWLVEIEGFGVKDCSAAFPPFI